jgi:hypothetical protein
MRASKPIRRDGVVPVIIISGEVIMVPPETTGAPVTAGVTLEAPPVVGVGFTAGIGAGTVVPGVIIGLAG